MNDLTGEKNVMLGGLAMGMSRDQVRERYDGIVDFSGINEKGDFISLPMRTYSSGMAARLRFSIAAAKDHDVLMIDEALATGDRSFQKRSEARIRELRKEAGTVFLVSHNNKSIRDTCDRVLWLERGELLMDGPTDEVIKAYENAPPLGRGPEALDPSGAGPADHGRSGDRTERRLRKPELRCRPAVRRVSCGCAAASASSAWRRTGSPDRTPPTRGSPPASPGHGRGSPRSPPPRP